jgi:tRNASer (uridine44-2'-O)-methyltransferase
LDPPMLQIELIPLPGTPTDPNSRLYRTCLALLDTLHRYGWGALAMTNYQKRVIHDCLVPREIYQDLYLIMRERHKYLVDTWKEVTDPLKHVFKVETSVIMHFINI